MSDPLDGMTIIWFKTCRMAEVLPTNLEQQNAWFRMTDVQRKEWLQCKFNELQQEVHNPENQKRKKYATWLARSRKEAKKE